MQFEICVNSSIDIRNYLNIKKMVEDSSESLATGDEGFSPKVRWAIPHRLDFMTFVGKEIFAIAHDIYIIFFNFKTNAELVYVANSQANGDGVDVIAGHRAYLFAFAEKVKNARIFIVTYPSFNILAELKDTDMNRYKGLCLMECDLVAGFSGFPNYMVSVWCWRTHQRLLSLPTGIVRRNQIYMASRTHMLICECWGEGLTVWEVAQCYKRCLMMKRAKEEKTGWDVSEPPLVGVCWTNEGQLYAIDPQANLYSVISDGIDMVTSLEWSEELNGTSKPCMCSFSNGILIYGPDTYLRSLKKMENKWKVAWSYAPQDEVVRLVSNSTNDMAAMWTTRGFVYKITGESEENIEVNLVAFKQRNITKIQLIAPDYKYLATMNGSGVLCIYEVFTAQLVTMKYVEGQDVSFEMSPVEPLAVIYGETGHNYGLKLLTFDPEAGLQPVTSSCLTHQIVSRVVFSPTGRELVAAAMSAGHIFIMQLCEEYKVRLVRYTELGRGLADCCLMRVGDAMRCFSLVLFSDKYPIGERIICINAETGKDNKFAGKMQGPYSRLLPLSAKDTMLAVPHLSDQYHVFKLSGDKGVTVSVKMHAVVSSGHDIKCFNGFFNVGALLTYGYDGAVVLRKPDASEHYDLKLAVSHRYESGVRQALVGAGNAYIVHVAGNRTCAATYTRGERRGELLDELRHEPPDPSVFDEPTNTISITNEDDKTYLDLQEEKKVHEEAVDHKRQRDEVLHSFERAQARLVRLLDENLAEPQLHRLPLPEFNLHVEHKKERIKQAEREREEIRLQTEARIRAQDKVTAWIKKQCWDTMLSPRVKLFAIFSHYQVENYAVLPSQRDSWPELQQTEALRALEMENDADVFRPWEEPADLLQVGGGSSGTVGSARRSADSGVGVGGAGVGAGAAEEAGAPAQPHVLSGSNTHRFVALPACMLPQTLVFSFLQMNWLQQIVKLNVQNMRLWFNKQFDELMNLKKREVGLVEERNARLRFIIEELNKLSDLRGSFHHLVIEIRNPEWRQEELTHKLIKVEPEECSMEPYISPSQVVVVPPDPGPKDDFRERALLDMMDGVLEKLWHEEIKKPIPMPQCMLDKDPEHFNEDDLRLVFEYEARVARRSEERDKYRKMLHAEYAKLALVLDEGVVRFNQRVKEMWLMKLKVDSVIGQENLNLMRLRRTNLDRVEMAEKIEDIRAEIGRYEGELEELSREQQQLGELAGECQAAYDALLAKDKYLDRTFKNHFADLSPIIVDQCYKFFKKRPKWPQRGAATPAALCELAGAVLCAARPPRLHADCIDYFKGVDQLDLISNMPPVMDEGLWTSMCKLRRAKIENEIRVRAAALQGARVEGAGGVWARAAGARRARLAQGAARLARCRRAAQRAAGNRALQLVLPAGQVEIATTGHAQDFEDATLILREDIEKINNVILKVGDMKLRMMRKQMDFRKGILSKEWEHAQMKMKLRHMEQELHSYRRLKIPKELQQYLKNKKLGYTEEQDYVRMEKEMEASKMSVNKILNEQIHRVEELELKVNALEAKSSELEKLIGNLNVRVSEKRLNEDPLEPIRIRRVFKTRMETLVLRSKLVREVQAQHSAVVLLQTQLELLRLKTYPTLASFRTLC